MNIEHELRGQGANAPRQPNRAERGREQTRLFNIPNEPVTSDDYYTPPELFEIMDLIFDIDVCAPPNGIPWIPAKRHFDLNDDGLQQEWVGRIWMNPPYSNTAPWMDRFIHHRNGVALIPTSRAQWFGRLWQSDAGIVHPTGTPMFQFVRPDGKRANIYMPVILAAFGDDNIKAISKIGKLR